MNWATFSTVLLMVMLVIDISLLVVSYTKNQQVILLIEDVKAEFDMEVRALRKEMGNK